MPMTAQQLDQLTTDYALFIPPSWRAIKVIQRITTHEEDIRGLATCSLCRKEFDIYEDAKEIIWSTSDRIDFDRISTLVCRNGIACRRRASASE